MDLPTLNTLQVSKCGEEWLNPDYYELRMNQYLDRHLTDNELLANTQTCCSPGLVIGYVQDLGKTVRVIYPDDMAIHPCTGCSQCYNNGTCTFNGDMEEIIEASSHADRIVVICAPVYTNTVPGMAKILIDRCLAWHTSRTIGLEAKDRKGVLVAVAGR